MHGVCALETSSYYPSQVMMLILLLMIYNLFCFFLVDTVTVLLMASFVVNSVTVKTVKTTWTTQKRGQRLSKLVQGMQSDVPGIIGSIFALLLRGFYWTKKHPPPLF